MPDLEPSTQTPLFRNSLLSLLLQTLANTLGTLFTGVLLGGVAVRVGLLQVDERRVGDVLLTLGFISLVATPTLLAYMGSVAWILNKIEPSRRDVRWAITLALSQWLVAAGLLAAILFFFLGIGVEGDPDYWVVWPPVLGLFVAALLVLRAAARVRSQRPTSVDELKASQDGQ
jgi:hypothetical protein